MEDYDESASASRTKPSKIPSWIMLGFILGALFVWPLRRSREPSPAPAATIAPSVTGPAEFRSPPPETHPRLSEVEAVFEGLSRFAVWMDNTTYICMWDTKSGTFRDYFEVLRRGDSLYFRSVDRPEHFRPRPDVPDGSPMQFLIPQAETRRLIPVTPPAAEDISVDLNPDKP